MVSTTNNNILMDSDSLVNDTIFLCDANTVLMNASETGLSMESAIKIYYPYLFGKNITNLEELEAAASKLKKESKALITAAFKRHIQSVSLLHNIQANIVPDTYDPVYDGLDSVELILHPVYSFKLPLELVFKLIQTANDIPFVKFYPALQREKMYRLFAPNSAKDGRRIPLLSKGEIVRYSKTFGASRRVTALIKPTLDAGISSGNQFACEFEEDGDIVIRGTFNQIIGLDVIEELIRQHVNPVIKVVSDYVGMSGYTLDLFDNLSNQNVEVLALNYKIGYPYNNQFNPKKFVGCVASVFNIEEKAGSSQIDLRYKRVSNFSEMDSIEAMIVKGIMRGFDEVDILEDIIEQQGKTEEEARQILAGVITNLQVIRNTFQNKRLRVKNDPGFPIQLKRNPETNNLDITINDISDVGYVARVKMFIDSVVRLVESPDSISIEESKIKSICKGKFTEVTQIEEVVAAPEKELGDNEEIEIVGEDVVFDDGAENEDYLDMLLGDDDDDEDEDEEGDSSSSQLGGAKKKDMVKDGPKTAKVTDVTGLSLGHPNPFFKRLKERDPALFLTKKDGKFNAYSKICQWNMRRQPVILSDAEKERIDKEHPGSYKHAIKYGTSKDNQNWYICPRYWSLSRNTSLTEEQVKSGKYGKVISLDENGKERSVVPPGEDIFEFNHTDKEGNYEAFYPGFVEPGSHPDGHCLPCCFRNYDSPKQVRLREICQAPKAEAADQAEEVADAATTSVGQGQAQDKAKGKVQGKAKARDYEKIQTDNYLIGAEKFPLDEGRWGSLVPSLQGLLDYDNKSCYVSSSNPVLKANTRCIVRQGIEPSRNQSFIAAIASAYAANNKEIVPSVDEMKDIIVNSITPERFAKYHNGNLTDAFYNDPSMNDSRAGDSNNDDDSLSLTLQQKLSNKVTAALASYKDFIQSPTSLIDHTYLWDTVCDANPKLFKSGLNLIILEEMMNDVTGNIQLICPSNNYSTVKFDIDKPTLILYKSGVYYEPIYVVEDKGKRYELTRFFSLKNDTILQPLKKLLLVSRQILPDMCSPLPSMPTVYTFRSNRNASTISQSLKAKNYRILSQVVNGNGQTIALQAKNNDGTIYVPTEASSNLPRLTITMLDDVSFWNDYNKTKTLLEKIATKTDNAVPTSPKMRVLEDGLTIGILTETNQVVMLAEPEVVEDDSLPILEESMSVNNDIISQTSTQEDKDRLEYVSLIRAESYFYNSFRNNVRMLLSRFENRQLRSEVEEIVKAPYFTYLSKVKQVSSLLNQLGTEVFMWKDGLDQAVSSSATRASANCLSFNTTECGKMPLCSISTDKSTCLVSMPKTNLLTGRDNEKEYYVRMADELIRYTRIRAFVFQPKAFLSFEKQGYMLHDNEILITQTILGTDYLDTLEPVIRNDFVADIPYQLADPIESVKYDSVFEGKTPEEENIPTNEKAIQTINKRIWGKWQTFFPSGSKELMFEPVTPVTTFDVLILILNELRKDLGDVTINELKAVLAEQYEMEIGSDTRIQAMWNEERKTEAVEQLKAGNSVDSVISLPTYFMSVTDLLLLAKYYNIPIVLYSAGKIKQNGEELLKSSNQTSSEPPTSYVFLKVPNVAKSTLPTYRIIIHKTHRITLPVSSFGVPEQKLIRELPDYDLAKEYKLVFRIKRKNLKKRVPKVKK
jgi:hypothetical protein